MAILFAAAAVVVAATAHGAEPSGLQQGLSYGRLDKSAVQLYAACVVTRCRSTDASNKWESSRLKASLRPRGGATSDSSAAPCDVAAVPKELAVTKAGSKADAAIAREWATEGKLAERKTMDFVDSLPHLRYVRTHGIKQFVSIYKNMRNATSNELLWGDEIEYMLVQLDREKRTAKLSLRGHEVLDDLQAKELRLGRSDGFGEAASWHPEYGVWMLEGTPRVPYGGYTADLRRVEANMRLRRKRLLGALKTDEVALTIPAFPLLGVGCFSEPALDPAANECTNSDSIPDGCILPNPRFFALTKNIRTRRGSNVDIRVPLRQDMYTPAEDLERGIRMDAMAYGMGCCCLQVTFQARDIDESRHLYDHLAVLSPILLALTAATPILRGQLADTDVRWATISASVDDRTPLERGETDAREHPTLSAEQLKALAGAGATPLPKSRYDSISRYLANCGACHKKFNDVAAPMDDFGYKELKKAGIDDSLARHVAHLFVRDPLVIHEGRVELDDENETDHFENLQSTNWQTVRWKPPPKGKACGPRIGWRVEFRSMEVQFTDFENAAFTVFVVLVSRVILAFDLNLYIPLSKVDENMRRAHARNAAAEGKFFFRKHMAPPRQPGAGDADGFEEMTISEILDGKADYFPGLVPLIFAYLESIDCDGETLELMKVYFDFIRKRASGELYTPAQWMRSLVNKHPEYEHDSKVSEAVAHDVLQAIAEVADGRRFEPRLHGEHRIAPLRKDDAWYVPLKDMRIRSEQREALLESYAKRRAL